MVRTLISILIAGLAGAIFYFYTEPVYNGLQKVQAQNAQYDSALSKATQLQALKQTLLSRYNSFNPTDIARLQTMLPDEVNDIGLILDLDTLASRYNMSLENVDVSASNNATTVNPSGIASVGASNTSYNSLTMKFTVHGSYATFLQFLTNLESSLSLVDVQSITMTPDAQVAGTTGSTYGFTVTLQMYWLK